MLSKEEMERLKTYLEKGGTIYVDTYIYKLLKKYIEQLETTEQKLIDKLEEIKKIERKQMKQLEHKTMAFHYANGRETVTNEILKILKGEKE